VKFLIDAQLPPVLQRVMEREGFEAVHAKDLGLAPSEDHEIRDYALANDFVVISKDDDFTAYALEPHNLKVIWVRTGNCKNKLLIEVLLANLPVCIELIDAGNSLVEQHLHPAFNQALARLLEANIKTSSTCSLRTPGNQARKSSTVAPASIFSKRAWT